MLFRSAVTTYQHFFNFARKNRSRGNRSPADILVARATKIDPRALLLPPIILSTKVGQDLSGPPACQGLPIIRSNSCFSNALVERSSLPRSSTVTAFMSSGVRMTCGVRKMSSSVFTSVFCFRLKA